MRIYEIAREVGVTSAEAVRVASEAGLDATSAISVVDADDEAVLRNALKGSDSSGVAARRAAKAKRASELGSAEVAAQRESLSAHLKAARDAAAGKRVSIAAPGAAAPQAAAATAAPQAGQSSAKPQIRMAPGHKAKPLPTVSAAQTGLTSAGFKPLQRARPAATISISVAAPPKQRPPKPAAEFTDDFEPRARRTVRGRRASTSARSAPGPRRPRLRSPAAAYRSTRARRRCPSAAPSS